ncbi:FecR family protein [Cupriavidus agavae]|uniref:FecR family protein n=2 Tax=Cupriavidus agavae TaxID=1001822 RepID=A0A4Q7S101_9BURK|nr:FecR family protein [Cupriavidus agavae]
MPEHHVPQDDALAPYQQELRERFPSVEAITAAAAARRRSGRRVRAGAAAALLLLASGIWLADPAYRTEHLQADAGAPRTAQLADGSEVTLDKGTGLTVQWRLRSRQLTLENGEAQFTVAHGFRSFVVTAGQTRVRDIGTVFDVRQWPQRTRVTVIEGAVEVEAGGRFRQLRASQQVDVGPDGRLPDAATTVDTERALAWQRDRFSFDGVTLADAVAEMQARSTAPIVIDDPRIAPLRLSGEFDREQVAAILQLLPGILPVTVRRTADGAVHLSAR